MTIADVVRGSGFPSMTVSRVINGKAKVREITRAAILRVIERPNYSPNLAAHWLGHKRISFITPIWITRPAGSG